MEIWRDIPGCEPYEVSSFGRVRNGDTLRVMSTRPNKDGVETVILTVNRKKVCRGVARLVAEMFIGTPEKNHSVFHIDGDVMNNSVENLEYQPKGWVKRMTAQLRATEPKHDGYIRDFQTGKTYSNSLECANAIGGFEDMVLLAAQSDTLMYMGRYFGFVEK